METLMVNMNTATKQSLESAAQQMNISTNELVNSLVEDFLKEKEMRFQAARSYVRTRYAELYKKLNRNTDVRESDDFDLVTKQVLNKNKDLYTRLA